MPVNHKKLRREYEAAKRDGTPGRFYADLSEALKEGHLKIEDFSVRQLFEEFVPDGREVVDSWNPRSGGGGVMLMEASSAVQTGVFSNITGQVIYTRMLEGYKAEGLVFSGIVPNVPTKFSGERLPGITNIGDEAEVVDEQQPFPQAGVSEDYIDTPATTKRGMIIGLTKEAIFFDRTNMLIPQCQQVGEYLGLNKEKRIIDAYIDQNTTAYRYKWKGTSYGTYQSSTPWVNVKTSNALVDWTSVDALEQVIAAIRDPYTNEPILFDPVHLVCCREKLYTAKRVVSATEIRVVTPGYATANNPSHTQSSNPVKNYQIVSSQLLSSRMTAASEATSDWFIGDISKTVWYMENWPLTVVPGPSNSEAEFTQDIAMRWKASERGTPVVVDPRRSARSSA